MQQPLKSLKLGSPGTGKNKKPVCVYVCLCYSVSKILFISFETFFYAANVNHIQGCWRLPPARIIQSSGFCSQSLSSHSPLPFPVIIPKCSAKLNEDSPYADMSWLARRCERPTRSHCPIRRLLLSHHPCVIPASRYAHNASHS